MRCQMTLKSAASLGTAAPNEEESGGWVADDAGLVTGDVIPIE